MKYIIDTDALREDALREISSLAAQFRSNEGTSLYDSIIPHSNDMDRLDGMVRESLNLLAARTYSISRWGYAREDKYYVIGSGGTRYLIRDEVPTSDTTVYHPDYSVWPGTLVVTPIGGKQHLAFTPQGMHTQVAGDLDTDNYAINLTGEALVFHVPDLPDGYEERIKSDLGRYVAVAVASQWATDRGVKADTLAARAGSMLQSVVTMLKTRKP